ncbi:hypothetical protein [Actinomadura kijaniata]|uniref:hypothetical protein n=1 Tax=Actinomadura kijaniata TaxID=46161 RepID=UPI00083161B3|nr:hypothetical protein [Actinomadura kijaniata]
MARRNTVRAAFALAAATVMAGTGAGTANAEQTPGAPAAKVATAVDCVVPGFALAFAVCSRPFLVEHGKRVHAHLAASGGKQIAFCVEPAGGGRDYGCTKPLSPGQGGEIWHNTTGYTQNVQLIAGPSREVDVRVQGSFSVR